MYFFRRRGRAQLSTRHGVWLGPARVIGVESSTGSPIPRLVWVSFNGFLNRCSPEGLRPVPEDEAEFKRLAKELASGSGPPDLESAENALRRGQYQDCTEELPQADDFELESDIGDEPDSGTEETGAQSSKRKDMTQRANHVVSGCESPEPQTTGERDQLERDHWVGSKKTPFQ